jgi:hypothetical protein
MLKNEKGLAKFASPFIELIFLGIYKNLHTMLVPT